MSYENMRKTKHKEKQKMLEDPKEGKVIKEMEGGKKLKVPYV